MSSFNRKKTSGSTTPLSASSLNSTSTECLFGEGQSNNARDKNLKDLLRTLPASPKDLLQRIDKQRDEIRYLQEENIRLKSKETEVSNLALKLQQQFSSTQNQVDNIKLHIQQQLSSPITEEEYQVLDATPESKRDLLDSIKLGIYRQLGSMRASYQSATKRAGELAASVSKLEEDNRDLVLQINELKQLNSSQRDKFSEKASTLEKHTARIQELETVNRDLETKLRNVFLSQEDFLSARLNAQVKTDEAARLAVRLEQAEMDVERYKVAAECLEQKLDILKSEYYEMKLKTSQRQLELEGALKAADEKIRLMGDLETESEMYLSNLAGAGDWEASGQASSLAVVPISRRLSHIITTTKRCLHLENKVCLLEKDLQVRDVQISRLQVSLQAAREALHNSNSPYALIEKTLNDVTTENDVLKRKIESVQQENSILKEKLNERNSDIDVLCKHRAELIKIKQLLKQLGYAEGIYFEEGDSAAATPLNSVSTKTEGKHRSQRDSSSCGALNPLNTIEISS